VNTCRTALEEVPGVRLGLDVVDPLRVTLGHGAIVHGATVEDDVLVLRGEKKVEAQTEEEGCYRLERAYGRFQRLIPLPDGVEVDKVEATFAKGVLTIQVPKAATAKPRGGRLQITGASDTRWRVPHHGPVTAGTEQGVTSH